MNAHGATVNVSALGRMFFDGGVCSGAGAVVLGEQTGDDSGMIINGTGSTFAMNTGHFISGGQSGTGPFEAENGGQATLGLVQVAQNPGSTGSMSTSATPTATATGSSRSMTSSASRPSSRSVCLRPTAMRTRS